MKSSFRPDKPPPPDADLQGGKPCLRHAPEKIIMSCPYCDSIYCLSCLIERISLHYNNALQEESSAIGVLFSNKQVLRNKLREFEEVLPNYAFLQKIEKIREQFTLLKSLGNVGKDGFSNFELVQLRKQTQNVVRGGIKNLRILQQTVEGAVKGWRKWEKALKSRFVELGRLVRENKQMVKRDEIWDLFDRV